MVGPAFYGAEPFFFPEPFFISEVKLSFCLKDTVDGSEIRRAPVEVDSLSHNLQGLIHPRWLFGISSINSISASRQSVGEKSLQHGGFIGGKISEKTFSMTEVGEMI